MADFSVRSDSVNVEQIMEQIRTRIREKRGVDYTEQQIRELAAVKLEKFLDPRGVRSDLLTQFKAQRAQEPVEVPNFAFEDATLFESHRGPIQWLRKLLLPILKLFFNPNPLIQALHIQSRLNTINGERETARRQLDALYYELIHNLVLETTRLGIDVNNLKMRLESVSSRLEFNERRARALESVVVYKPSAGDEERPARQDRGDRGDRGDRADRGDRSDRDRGDRDRGDRSARHQSHPQSQQRQYAPPPQPAAASTPSAVAASPETAGAVPATPNPPAPAGGAMPAEGPGQRSRRRRRRRGRRGGGSAATLMGAPGAATAPTAESSGEGSAPLPGEEGDAFDDTADEAGGDDQSVEAPAASGTMTTHHDPPAEPVQSTAPPHASSPAPPGDTLHEERSAPPPGPGNGDTDPQ